MQRAYSSKKSPYTAAKLSGVTAQLTIKRTQFHGTAVN